MTNLIQLRSVEQFNAAYKPSYNPILPLFIRANAVKYAVEAGKVNFTAVETIGDLENKFLGPKDTELHQIGAREGSKTFKKAFFASQYRQSAFQSNRGFEDVVAQVLDTHNKQADKMFLTGEGTANNNVVNNGLFYSSDPNYVSQSSLQIAKDAGGNHLAALYAQMVSDIQTAQEVDGELLVMMYGATSIAKFNGLFPTNSNPFAKVINDALETVSFAKVPAAMNLSGSGYIIVNLDQTRLHYTQLPQIRAQGVNEEKEYAWTNFLMGNTMLEVQAPGAVYKQPLTYEA